jgi:hypothetical protein
MAYIDVETASKPHARPWIVACDGRLDTVESCNVESMEERVEDCPEGGDHDRGRHCNTSRDQSRSIVYNK